MTQYHIEKEVKSFMDKSFSKRQNNTKYTTFAIAGILLLAAWAGHSVTDVSGTPSSDTVFYWMETSLERLDKTFRHYVEKILKQKRGYWRRHTPYLLVDETHESYSGKLLKKKWKSIKEKSLCKYIFGYKPKKGDTGSFRFLTFALVGPTKKLIVRSIPIIADIGTNNGDGIRHPESQNPHIIDTIRWIRKHMKFRLVIFDRGFYDEKLIYLLKKEKVKFLIRAKLSTTMKNMIAGMTTKWTSIKYNVGETYYNSGEEVDLVIGKDKTQEWALVTNYIPKQVWRMRHYYKKRWNIENMFQVCDGINVHTNSTEIEKKTFCFIISCLIYNLWQFSKERIKGMTLRRFTRLILKRIERILNKPPPDNPKGFISNEGVE